MLFRPTKNLKELPKTPLVVLKISMKGLILWPMAHSSPEIKGTELDKHRRGGLIDGEIITMGIMIIRRRGDRHFRAKEWFWVESEILNLTKKSLESVDNYHLFKKLRI
jgi:hypothetical protein